MRVLRKVSLTLVLMGLTLPALAQTPQPPTTGPATSPAAANAWEKNLPELRFDNVSFDDVASFLSDVTGINIVVLRASNVPPGQPMVTCRLKNVTVDQFTEFLQAAYGVATSKIDGPAGPITMMKVELSDAVLASMNQGGGPRATVDVVNLRSVIGELQTGNKDRKSAINDVMSLIQTTMGQIGGTQPSLKVHEATESLVFKGTNEQRLVLQSLIATLQPSADAQRRILEDQLRDRENASQIDLAKMKVENNALERQNEQLEKEVAQLRQQLNTNRPATNP